MHQIAETYIGLLARYNKIFGFLDPNRKVPPLAYHTARQRADDAEARDTIRNAFGEAGLIEISLAMNGAALLPGVKRAMGYATACDIQTMHKLAKAGNG